jgi:hypothetical protein
MKYKEVTYTGIEGTQKHIIIDNGDGSFKSFPADETNPEYIAFLAELEATPNKTPESTV